MKKMFAKSLAVLLAAFMLLTAAPLSGFVGLEWPDIDLPSFAFPEINLPDFDFNFSADAATIVKSGTCGTNVTYTLDSDGVLTIAGTGSMNDYSKATDVPWNFNRSQIIKVVIEDGVTSIGKVAFAGCTSLIHVTIPISVTNVGDSSFRYCTSIKNVYYNGNINDFEKIKIGVYNADFINSIKYVSAPSIIDTGSCGENLTWILDSDGVLTIAGTGKMTDYSFDSYDTVPWYSNRTAIKKVVFKNNVTSIGGYAFSYCTSLTTITIPDSITSIGDGAFSDCTSLTTITIPHSVTSIGEFVFTGCTSQNSINVDLNNSKYLSANGILYNKDITTLICYPSSKKGESFVIPDTVTNIGASAFSGCTELISVTISDSVTSIGESAFRSCTSLTAVNIPDAVTSIGNAAFCDCTSLTAVNISDSVTSIALGMFSRCTALTTIAIPFSVSFISAFAFNDCIALKNVYYAGSEDDWKKIVIGYNNEYLTKITPQFVNTDTNFEKYTSLDEKTLVIISRNADEWDKTSLGNASLPGINFDSYWKLKGVIAKIGSKTFSQDKDKRITIKRSEITDDIILSVDDFYNYIIPKHVALSFVDSGITDVVEYIAYMKKEIKNGKPYISSVFIKDAEINGQYTNICKDSFTASDEKSYHICITADNLNESATYYISQDEAHRIESKSGDFATSELYQKLVKGKDTYVYFITKSGVVSDRVKVKLSVEESEKNLLKIFEEELTNEGKLSLGGTDGLSITLPEDWILIGGSTIDLYDLHLPVGVKIQGDEVLVSVGFDLFKRSTTTKTTFSSTNKNTFEQYEPETESSFIFTKKYWQDYKGEIAKAKNAFKNVDSKMAARELKKALCERYGAEATDYNYSQLKNSGFGIEAMGYIESHIVNGRLIVTDMCIAVAGEYTLSYSIQLSKGYLGIEGGGKLTIETNWSRETADLIYPLEFGLTASGNVWIKARGGVGWDGVASAGLYGKGDMPLVYASKEKQLALQIIGTFGYEAQFLIWKTGEKVLLKGETDIFVHNFGNSSVNRALPANVIDDDGAAKEEYTLTDRVQPSAWWGDSNLTDSLHNRVGVTSADELTFKTLQSNVFNLSDAKIISAGENTLAVWVAEDAARDDYNRLKLVYSVYDKVFDTWSEPKAVYDNGFMDASPVLATDGENIFVAWQKFCKTFTADSGNDIAGVLAAAEIYTAKYDAASDTFIDATRITNDSVYDYRPSLTVVDGDAVVVYASNKNNDVLTVDGNSITKVQSGIKTVLAKDLASLNNLACVADENEIKVAYSVDTDGNLKTTNDISVFSGTDSFEEFAENASLTNFIYADYNGEKTLFVSDGKNIYYSDNGEIKPILEEDVVISTQLQAVNESEGLAFYWLATSESGNELYTCSNIDGEWTNAICLSERENDFSNLAVTVSDKHVIGIANETQISYDETTQTYTKGATNFVFFKENDRFDLAMMFVDLDENNLTVGETAFLEVTAENVGNVKAENLTFTVTDSNGTENEYLVEETLLPGKSIFWKIPYTIPANIAQTNVTVTVSADAYTDADMTDNSASCGFETAALIAEANEVTEIEKTFIFSADITNNNFAIAKNVSAAVRFNDPTGDVVSTVKIGDIAKDSLAVAEFAFTEKDLVFDENGVAVIYMIIKADNAEDTICAFTVEQSTPAITLGDVDNNGKIEAADARLALRAAVKLETLTEAQTKAADADKDGEITSSDARLILRAAVGLGTL